MTAETITAATLVDGTDRSVRPRRGRIRRAFARTVPPLLVAGLVLGVWYATSNVLLDPQRRFLLPSPDQVVQVAFLNPDNLAELLSALAFSAQVALVGLLFSVVIGVGLAVLMSQAGWLERSLYPYAVVLQTIPILALVPLFGYWFGFGFGSRVLTCVLISIFPIIANTLFGLRSVDQGHLDLFRLHGAGRLTRLFKLQLPAALPAIFTGLRISAGASVIGAVVGDFFFRQGQPGIGMLIDVYRAQLQAEKLFAAVILSSLFGLVVFWVFTGLSRWVTSWHESTRNGPVS